MSTLKVLKEYLVGEGEYLLNPDNNGKTVMLSGAWGSGKTHFWQNEISREQKKIEVNGKTHDKYTKEEYEDGLSYALKEKKKSCVYISLYGKDSLSELKKEVLFRASTESDYLSDDIEAFGFNALATIDEVGGAISTLYKVASNMNESRRDKKGTNRLKDGGIICFDDFERKSKNIDLNDLFGFISQLAIGLNCKVVIILNSDVFEGEEANVFKTVKEKTVNKFFYFEPTIEELFKSIYNSDEKYNRLDDYRNEILSAIKETDELNARIYIQVLDNCLEWVNNRDNYDIFRELVLCTIFFTNHHYSLGFEKTNTENKVYDVYDAFLENIEISQTIRRAFPQYAQGTIFDAKDIIHSLKGDVTKKKSDNNDNANAEVYYAEGYKLIEENKYMLRDFYYYIYILKVENEVDSSLFNEINIFVKTGILIKDDTV